MEYSISKLAKLSGVSTRTLRYYDEIKLLSPTRISSNGYRIYGQQEVNRLQQILFYRELGFPLDEIGRILDAPDFDRTSALANHMSALIRKKQQIELLIDNVAKTISEAEGGSTMSDKEKFEGFKKTLVQDNETKYGDEIRQQYGDKAVDASNAKVLNMSQEDYDRVTQLSQEINDTLKAAMQSGNPAGEIAQKCCDLHRQWLCYYWPKNTYSKEAHLGLAQMYCDDLRFKQYYENIASGAAEFLLEAMKVYCK
ncbi:DNA-binding transcriptional MerR regulator [Clostridiales Family XIII bacterium PM5-7]